MSATKARKPFRPPPKLRTKTGCITCRNRRKKCDERRPICATCQRLKISCVYREASETPSVASSDSTVGSSDRASDTESVVDIPSPPLYSNSLWHPPSGLRTQQDFNVFQYCAERYIRLLIYPEADAEFRDVSFLFAAGYDHPFVLHAALAPAALHASCAALIPREDAMVYTQSALHGLRQASETLTTKADARAAFLAASLFMGVFEDFYPAASSSSLTHYRAISEVLEENVAALPRLRLSDMSIFERTLLDSVLYHFSTRLLLAENIDQICASFPTDTIAKYIEALECESSEMLADPPALPVIGKIPPSLFLLIYQTTWLSRQLPFVDMQQHTLALQCREELDRLQEANPILVYEESDGASVLRNPQVSAKLYALALRIFLAKVIDPDEVTSTSPLVEHLLATGLALLRQYDGDALYGQFVCWPILVLGCASCPTSSDEVVQQLSISTEIDLRSQTRVVIQGLLVRVWKVSFSGYVRRTASALERIWKLPDVLCTPPSSSPIAGSKKNYDGLRALVSKSGLGPGLFPD